MFVMLSDSERWFCWFLALSGNAVAVNSFVLMRNSQVIFKGCVFVARVVVFGDIYVDPGCGARAEIWFFAVLRQKLKLKRSRTEEATEFRPIHGCWTAVINSCHLFTIRIRKDLNYLCTTWWTGLDWQTMTILFLWYGILWLVNNKTRITPSLYRQHRRKYRPAIRIINCSPWFKWSRMPSGPSSSSSFVSITKRRVS